MQKINLSIGGMSCSACSTGLEKYLNKQDGIVSASVNLVLGNVSIEYQDNLTIDDLSNLIKEAGFTSLGIYREREEEQKISEKVLLVIFGILSILVLSISMSHMIHLPVIPFLHMINYTINYSVCLFILSIPYLFYGFDIFKNGYLNFMHKTPNMDTLVSIGVLSSFLYSVFGMIMILKGEYGYVENLYFESACIVLFFIKLGRFIDLRSKEKTRDAIKGLVQITPTKALLKTKDGSLEVTIDEVKVGDILICKPGMKVAVDGTITEGRTHCDESFITGESLPVMKEKNSKVVAGSFNIDGYIEYKALKIGRDSTISEIVRLVVEATSTKAPISKVADIVSGIFVPSIMIIAGFTFLVYLLLGYGLDVAFTHFVTVLVVACPCALGLATPLAIVVSVGLCAQNGILVKRSEILENAHKVDTIVFDKTGTLTYGSLLVSKVYNYSTYQEKDLIKIVASIERKSTHPIASAFQSERCDKLFEVKDFKNIQGIGLSASIGDKKYFIGSSKILVSLGIKNKYEEEEQFLQQGGNSIVYVVENKKIIAIIGVKDIVRENAKSVIRELKRFNKEVIMLTGDNVLTANIIAKELGINQVIANVLPKNKTNKIKELMQTGKRVMMIGDGINDAPSLATATIGVSLSSGTDIANDSADVILMSNNLMSLVHLIKISKVTVRNIKQNLFWAFFYNICMIPIAIGLLSRWNIFMNPMIAGFAMTVSSLTVIFNALRLKKIKLERS